MPGMKMEGFKEPWPLGLRLLAHALPWLSGPHIKATVWLGCPHRPESLETCIQLSWPKLSGFLSGTDLKAKSTW
jgi:hypothetical protein